MSVQRGAVEAPPAPHVPEKLWLTMLVRAVPALAAALIITFAQERPAGFALLVFGSFGLATGVLIGFEAVGVSGHPTRGITFARAVVTTLAGGVALVLVSVPGAATPSAFLSLVAGWAGLTGVLETVAGIVARRYPAFSRDVMMSGVLTLLLALLLLWTPADLRYEYGGLEEIPGELTASVQGAGFFGAYATVLAVLLIIESLTLRASRGDVHTDGVAAEAQKDAS